MALFHYRPHTCAHTRVRTAHTHTRTRHLRGGLGRPLVLADRALLLGPGSREEKKSLRHMLRAFLFLVPGLPRITGPQPVTGPCPPFPWLCSPDHQTRARPAESWSSWDHAGYTGLTLTAVTHGTPIILRNGLVWLRNSVDILILNDFLATHKPS